MSILQTKTIKKRIYLKLTNARFCRTILISMTKNWQIPKIMVQINETNVNSTYD